MHGRDKEAIHEKLKHSLCVTGLSLLFVTLNFLGDKVAVRFALPIWLDSFGTMLAGYLFGPVTGGMVGIASHVAICIGDHSVTYLYALANMMVGILVGIAKKNNFLTSFQNLGRLATTLALISTIISAPLTLLFRFDSVGNFWGNGAAIIFQKTFGIPKSVAIFMGEFYVDFVDKLFLMFLLYTLVEIHQRRHHKPSKMVLDTPYGAFVICTVQILTMLGILYAAIDAGRKQISYTSFLFKTYLVVVLMLITGWFTWLLVNRVIKRELDAARKRESMLNSTILTIAHMVDARDIYTAKHSARVTKYSLLLGKELGFSKEEMHNLEHAALLHDIGKVGIPDGILNKKGKLSQEEFQVMKTHPLLGHDILKDFDFAPQISEGARYHHERWDGTGYPDGLMGENIPLFGRIIGVADAYDAMSSRRIYRPKCTKAYIIEEFRKGCGTQFDPKLCNIFLSLIENGKVTDDNLEPSSNNISLPQIFERFGGRYSVIQARLKSDEVIRQYIHEFLEDEQFEKLKQSLEAGDDRAAFAAVHTMKGIALNLEMENLAQLCMALTENLRNDSIHPRTWDLFTQVEQEYNEVCALIHQMEQV